MMKEIIIFAIGAAVGMALSMVLLRRTIRQGMDRWNDRPLKRELDAPPQDCKVRADRL